MYVNRNYSKIVENVLIVKFHKPRLSESIILEINQFFSRIALVFFFIKKN